MAMALLASGDSSTRPVAGSLRRNIGSVAVVAAAFVMSLTLAAPEAAADHDTVGGGRFAVSNSDTPCTDFQGGGLFYTACPGQSVNLAAPAKYIIVPLSDRSWVSCETYAPDGSVFEHDDENLAEVSDSQQFWIAQGWGLYTPQAMCQLW
jgi:hypothetical protein